MKKRSNILADIFRSLDIILLALCGIVTIFGIIMIKSATNYMETNRYVIVQIVATAIGIILYIVVTQINIKHFTDKAWIWMALSILIWIILLLTSFGVADTTGNRAWLKFPFLPVSIQPIEIAKILYIPLLAKQLAYFKEERDLRRFVNVIPLVIPFAVLAVLYMYISSDMGSTLVVIFCFLVMCFLAGVAYRWFFLTAGAGALAVYILWNEDIIPNYMKSRFIVLFDHTIDTQGVGWHQTRSLMTLGGGRIFGQGLFHGTQTQSSYSYSLPSRHTDFIFSVIGEELGMFGCFLVIAFLTAIIVHIVRVGNSAETLFDKLVCIGIASMVAFQTLSNIGMCIFVFPVIGLTLPFISYGGSSIVTMFWAMGIVSNIHSRALPDWLQK